MAFNTIANDKNHIALTFDDGPNQYTEPILEILQKHQVQATFFQIGKKIQETPDLTRRVITEGHELGNHSMTHPRLPELESLADIQKEIQDFQTLSGKLTGTTPKVFRAPYIKFDERVWAVLDQLGLPAFNAHVWADYKGDGTLDDPAIASAHAQAAAAKVKSGSIILMHEREITLHYLDEFVAQLKEAGFIFVTLSDLMEASEASVNSSRASRPASPNAIPPRSRIAGLPMEKAFSKK